MSSSDWKANPKIAALLKRGIDCKNADDVAGAIAAFEQAIKESPRCSLAYWLLGGMQHYYRDDPKAALPYFQKAVALSPRTEKASLGLFHALWSLDRVDEALEEIKRFQLLTNWSSQDYWEIVDEIREKWLDAAPRKSKSKSGRDRVRS